MEQQANENKDYDGFADIRKNQFDANESTPRELPQEKEEEELCESVGDLNRELPERGSFYSIGTTLIRHAQEGLHHHEILNAIDKHIPGVPHEDDAKLNHIVRSAENITPEIHSNVLNILSHHANETQTNREPGKGRESMDLIHKYEWVLHHSPTTVPPQANREEGYLAEEHVKKYAKDFTFEGGRILRGRIIGSYHHLNHDGTLSSVRGTTDERYPGPMPHVPENHIDSAKFHKFNLEGSHTAYIKDSKATENIVSRYTNDSKHINKTAAEFNKGNGDPKWEGHDNNDKEVIAMHKAVANAPTYEHKFTVYTGMSRSTNPLLAEESSPGKKTVHMKAFTSTSLDEPTARGFAIPEAKDPSIPHNIHDMLEIHVPAGHKGGLYVDHVSANKGESEYVLDHGTRIEHDSTPKYFAHNGRLFRVWKNGNIVGNKKHDDFSIERKEPEEHTASYVTRLQESQLPMHRMEAAASPAATNRHLNVALDDENKSVRFNAAANPNASAENLKKAASDESYQVVKAAIANPNVTAEHLNHIVNTNAAHPETKLAVLDHPLSTQEHADKYISDSNTYVRQASVIHPKISKEKLTGALKDKDGHVARSAKLKLGTFNEEIISLMLKATEILKEG